MNDLKMNLKICEGCGALWLRNEAVGGVYCSRCKRVFAEFPSVRELRNSHLKTRRIRPVSTGMSLVGGAQ